MMSHEENLLLTQTGPGTPAGAVMRRYWQPAALTDELSDGPRPVRPVTLLGERLVLFRDAAGGLNLIGRHCPHRGADLAFGRLEDGGLRCPFHGWLFDGTGACLEQPAEPEGSTFHQRLRHTAYPVVERNGILWAWLGEGAPPPLPELDCLVAPRSHTFAFKGLIEANWLQSMEVGIDPAHASFLHRYLEDEDPATAYGKQFRDRVADTDMPMTQLLREYPRPDLSVEETAFGLRIIALRRMAGGHAHVRVTNQVFPHAIVIPMSNTMTITQWHVPVDDLRCYWYAIFTSFDAPVDHALMRRQRLELYRLPDYVPTRHRGNDWGYDPAEQAARTYTGMGLDINVHDQWAVESPGPLQDRTAEHLGQSDKAIIRFRRLWRRAIEAARSGDAAALAALPLTGPRARLAETGGPAAVDAIAPAEAWQAGWQHLAEQRRAAAPWADTARDGAPAAAE